MLHLAQVCWRFHRTLIHGRFVGQRTIRNFGDHRPALLDSEHPVGRYLADMHRVQVPLVEDPLDLGFAAAFHDEQHPLL